MLEARVNFIIKELYNDDEDILNITWEKCTMPKETHDINQHKGNYNPYQGSFAHVSTHPSIRYTAQTILTNAYQQTSLKYKNMHRTGTRYNWYRLWQSKHVDGKAQAYIICTNDISSAISNDTAFTTMQSCKLLPCTCGLTITGADFRHCH